MSKIFLNFVLITCLLIMLGCSDKPLSVEEEIEQYIEQGKQAAEKRDTGDVLEFIDDSYRDEKGFDKKQIKRLLQLYFFRHKNIFLFTRIDEIKVFSNQQAEVKLHVAMAGKAISAANLLSSLRARVYRFELQLEKRDKWLLKSAKWQPASVSEIQ